MTTVARLAPWACVAGAAVFLAVAWWWYGEHACRCGATYTSRSALRRHIKTRHVS